MGEQGIEDEVPGSRRERRPKREEVMLDGAAIAEERYHRMSVKVLAILALISSFSKGRWKIARHIPAVLVLLIAAYGIHIGDRRPS